MTDQKKEKFYLVEKRALPEVFRKVIQVKEGIRTNLYPSINQAVKAVGISRSAYYKYHKSVFLDQETDFDSAEVFELMIKIDLASQNEILLTLESNSAKIVSIQQSPITKSLSNIQIVCRSLHSNQTKKIIRELTKINGVDRVNHHRIRE